MAGTINSLEIFATGTHRASTGTMTVVDEDLDKIVDAFSSLHGSNIVRPHLKLGHTEAQKWFGQKDGIPALGWIVKVWRQGRKLLADVVDVPDALIEMIRSGRFHNVSAEVFWDVPIKHEGRQFSRVLSAVAILGVQMPAVKDLDGLASALFQTKPIHQFTGEPAISLFADGDDPVPEPKKGDAPLAIYTQAQTDSLIEAAVAKAMSDASAKFAEEKKGLETNLKVAEDRAKAAEGEITKVKAEAAQKEATTLVDQAIKDGKMLPKQRDFALAALSASDVKLKFGADGEEKPMAALFKDFLDAQGKVIDPGEKGDGKNKVVEFATAAEELDHRVKACMAADTSGKTDYAVAFDTVMAADDDLKQRYANSQV